MSDLRQQIHDHYQAQSLPAEKVEAILGRGREVAGQDESKIVRLPSAARWWRAGLALAAAVALFAGVLPWWPRPAEQVSFAVLTPRVVEFFGTPPELPKRSQDKAELKAWLLAQGAPADFHIPAKLMPMESLGCQVVDVQGRPAWLTCFWREKGELVHLFAVRRSDFRDGPASATPQMQEHSGWSFASWTEGDVIYTLATAAPLEKLRPFVWTPRKTTTVLARL
jgi:hypothetical protein